MQIPPPESKTCQIENSAAILTMNCFFAVSPFCPEATIVPTDSMFACVLKMPNRHNGQEVILVNIARTWTTRFHRCPVHSTSKIPRLAKRGGWGKTWNRGPLLIRLRSLKAARTNLSANDCSARKSACKNRRVRNPLFVCFEC